MSFTVYLVRHGQTYFNRYNRMQGWCDSPLTDQGIADAQRAGQTLSQIRFTAGYSSDTTRAMNTAKYINEANQHPLPQLGQLAEFREEFYGYFEGADSSQTWFMVGQPHGASTFKEILAKYPIEKSKDFFRETDPFHEAEDNATFWQRLDRSFDYLRAHHHDGDQVFVVTHGTTLRSIAGRYAPEVDLHDSPKNGGITKLTVSDTTIHIDFFNQVSLPQ